MGLSNVACSFGMVGLAVDCDFPVQLPPLLPILDAYLPTAGLIPSLPLDLSANDQTYFL